MEASFWAAVHFKIFLSMNLINDILMNKEKENRKLAHYKRIKLNILNF